MGFILVLQTQVNNEVINLQRLSPHHRSIIFYVRCLNCAIGRTRFIIQINLYHNRLICTSNDRTVLRPSFKYSFSTRSQLNLSSIVGNNIFDTTAKTKMFFRREKYVPTGGSSGGNDGWGGDRFIRRCLEIPVLPDERLCHHVTPERKQSLLRQKCIINSISDTIRTKLRQILNLQWRFLRDQKLS